MKEDGADYDPLAGAHDGLDYLDRLRCLAADEFAEEEMPHRFATNKESQTANPTSPAGFPGHEDTDRAVSSLDDEPMSVASATSLMLDSIMTGFIESIAMLSVEPTFDRGKEGATKESNADEKMNRTQEEADLFCVVHDGPSTRVYHCKNPRNNFGGQTGEVAIKVPTDEFPDSDQISKLKNEYDVSVKLAGRCKAVRAAFGLTGLVSDGPPALYLKWVPGRTLREWAELHPRRQDHLDSRNSLPLDEISNGKMNINKIFLEQSLRLALKITKCLGDIHQDGGFILNNISARNIIVNEDNDEVGTFSVYFIGLGSATCLQTMLEGNGKTLADNKGVCIRNDLRSLGEVLFELFSGQTPFRSSFTSQGKDDRLSLGELRSTLILSSVPPFIASLILDLMEVFETNHEDEKNTYDVETIPFDAHYQSAYWVENKLSDILLNLETNLAENSVGWLQIPAGKLYGCEQNQTKLIDIYQRVALDKTHEVVAVSGLSGVGKTALITETLRKPLSDIGGQFIHIKFDQLKHGEPLAAIVASFSEFCNNLADDTANDLSGMKCVIQRVLGTELLGVLTAIIPALCTIAGTKPSASANTIENLMAKNQFKFAFQILIKAFIELNGPVTLFFDDLQWADSASIELLDALVVDIDIKPFLVIECFRENEIAQDHPLNAHLDEIRRTGVVFNELYVGILNARDVCKLISEAIKDPIVQTKPLAAVIHHKSGGNALLVIQFIRSIWDEGLLRYSSLLKTWTWDLELMKSKKVLDDAANIMAQAISFLPSNTRYILQKMACLGCQCDESVLCTIVREDAKDSRDGMDDSTFLLRMLGPAIYKGLVEKVGSKFKFTHDQIQQAVYLGIPENKRTLWHTEIGQLLLKQYSGKGSDNSLFVIVDQLNQGRSLIKGEDGFMSLAWLNYCAGEKAMSAVSFPSAAAYLRRGISILEENNLMKKDRTLCIKMYVLFAESEYCNGNFGEMHKAQDFIFTHAGCLDDKLPAYSTLIRVLAAQNKLEGEIEMGMDVLAQLGETFPNQIHDSFVLEEFSKTEKMLKESNLTSLKTRQMVDKHKKFAIEILEYLSFAAYMTKQEFLAPFTFRMVQLTLSFGVCPSTPLCFALYSRLKCGVFQDIKGADMLGKLALEILECPHTEQKIASVYLTLYSFIFCWTKPLHLHLEPMLDAYHKGMKAGDNHFAMLCGVHYAYTALHCGKELPCAMNHCDDFMLKMQQYKQHATLKYLLAWKLAVMTLMGQEDTPVLVEGVEITFETLLADAIEKQDQQQLCRIYLKQTMLAYLFGKYELAGQIADKSRDLIGQRMGGKFTVCEHAFYDGLTLLVLSRDTKQDKWTSLFHKSMNKVQKYSAYAPFNVEHKILLLEAEYAFLTKEDNTASSKYDAAIALAGKNGFVQDQALAYERAGIYYLEKGNTSQASHYLGRAHNAYIEWGAKGKAGHVCACYPF